ncbi:hypothetical protein Desaf_3530 [Desulfocurvibacter africanus subsp. africanus str. Walvis Bay]|uniref:Uncharacterized protein n=1 Tax=Desulfocurvibacter africanus subsp. africanus str. Walvis Bay TaxID=690850 RepID=F3YY35_DESAF|nr:hypothetical protein Desaf_3530 [Desulfocurvibacter africanus subsp. africanus str. Walvis Bay]
MAINKTAISQLIAKNAVINGAVTLDGIPPAVESDPRETPRRVNLEQLKAAVHWLEGKFSGNCDCLSNPDCCQTCQTITCQSQASQCTCQSCQACQAQCSSTNCDTTH